MPDQPEPSALLSLVSDAIARTVIAALHKIPRWKDQTMPLYRKKPVEIEAHQWFKNDDHPDDGPADREGKIVRFFRRPEPEYDGQTTHDLCGRIWHDHGWIDTLEGGHIVCPGDWIITGVQGERYPCKPEIFTATYEPAAPAGLRDRIAAAMRAHYLSSDRDAADADGRMPCVCADWREPSDMDGDEYDWDAHVADAVLAVLPTPAAEVEALRARVAELSAEGNTLRDRLNEATTKWAGLEQQLLEADGKYVAAAHRVADAICADLASAALLRGRERQRGAQRSQSRS